MRNVPYSTHSRFAGASAIRGGRTTGRRHRCQPGNLEFIFAVGQGGDTTVHGFGDGFVHQVHDEFVRQPDIAGSVFGRAIVTVAGSHRHDRRTGAERIEETEGRGIDFAVRAYRSNQRNRARRYQAGQHPVGTGGVFAFKIEFHHAAN